MGAKDSKISFLPYEEAVKRVSERELEQVRNAFRCFAGSTNFISKTTFFNDVLGDLVPARLSEQLYITCGGTSKGIALRDLFVMLVLITNGTIDEKLKFLFNLMSVDGSHITREDLENFYNACDGGSILPRCINEAFWRTESLSYDEFYKWLTQNHEFSTVTRWLLEEQMSEHRIRISSNDNTPSFYSSLAKLTKLSVADINALERKYWELKSISRSGRLDLESFKAHVVPTLPEQFCKNKRFPVMRQKPTHVLL